MNRQTAADFLRRAIRLALASGVTPEEARKILEETT